ncbi:MAG: TerB family tellurite resistance protein [Pseudomonadota bacterium]
MPIILMLLGLLAAGLVWYWRLKMAREAGGELLEAAGNVRSAVRRFGYRRKSNKHPVDCVEDARLAASGIMAAVAGMDGPLSRSEIDAIAIEARAVFKTSPEEADEIAAFGRWIAGQCVSPDDAVRRLTKVTRRLAGVEAGPDLIAMTERVAIADGAEMTDGQQSAVAMIRRLIEPAR